MRKAFLEKVVVELLYKFDEKSYRDCLKGELIAKVRLKNIFGPQTSFDLFKRMQVDARRWPIREEHLLTVHTLL